MTDIHKPALEHAHQTAPTRHARPRRVVIIVENLALPFDRRVWQECQALRDAGWEVSAICPVSDRHPERHEIIDGIEIFRHPLPLEARGKAAFLLEYGSALWHESRLLFHIARKKGFDVIQACNPPDLMFLVALPYKLFGKRFVFDHHDSAPSLYVAKYGDEGPFYKLLRLFEWMTFKVADRIVTANESYRENAIARGKRRADEVTSVYSVPDTRRIRRVAPDPVLRGNARVVLGYVGIIGDQDGVDHLVRMVAALVAQGAADGVRAVVVGDGPALASVRALAAELNLGAHIHFTGYLSGEALMAALSSFDIGIIPDPVNPYNDKISMNKVFEYSALGVPSVAYNLAETRRLLGDTASYADDATPEGLARACLPLIQDEAHRHAAGAAAKALADAKFIWDKEAAKFVGVYDALLPAEPRAVAAARG
ncbi:glycosyltransferase family 4 protein [Sphingomonas morindae]|uniref:Glycosyltransferase family 4 protein n=1 Tax=Sphingomonas morindae TaxID=1541170 RepID=A0ABY4X6D2_9SPHN|nr:glycosyltransferase family 4 protein [Sphingomonas morindae]USI72479.1 glycosyltransferase family 4 protein [Sphingomonas morindae]